MKLVIVSATRHEISPLLQFLKNNFKKLGEFRYELDTLKVDLLITGIGIPASMYALMKYLQHNECDQILNAGIAGTFQKDTPLGKVFLVEKQTFGDLGVQEANGQFLDLFDMEMMDSNASPFQNGWLHCSGASEATFLDKASSITVNKVSGQQKEIDLLRAKYDAELESMEGAAIAYISLMEKKPFLEVRAVSNFIEDRDRNKWDIPLAIEKLNETLIQMITFWKDISSDMPIPTR